MAEETKFWNNPAFSAITGGLSTIAGGLLGGGGDPYRGLEHKQGQAVRDMILTNIQALTEGRTTGSGIKVPSILEMEEQYGPVLAQILGARTQAAEGAMGFGGLRPALADYATQQASLLGTGADPREQRQLQQQVLGSAATRGLANSGSAVGAITEGLGNLNRAAEDRRLGVISSLLGSVPQAPAVGSLVGGYSAGAGMPAPVQAQATPMQAGLLSLGGNLMGLAAQRSGQQTPRTTAERFGGVRENPAIQSALDQYLP